MRATAAMRAAPLVFAAAGALAQAPVDPAVYGRKAATELGCVCKSECSTSTLFGCFSQAWCTVQDQKCARGNAPYSLGHGYYDYCVYPAYAQYESKSAAEKAALIAERLTANSTSGAYPSGTGFAGIFTESVIESFNSTSDVFTDPGRVRYIHSVGTVAPVKFVRTGGSYTGMFQGADHGLIRLSSANAPGVGDSKGFTPGAAVKLFRDGTPSANFVALPSLDGQPCNVSDYFARNFTNHAPAFGSGLALTLLSKKFWQASFCPLMVGLSDLAAVDQAGKAVSPVFPYQLSLSAGKGATATIPCSDYAQGLANIAQIPPGTHLFEVNAQAAPGAPYKHIGYFELTGRFATSSFGDNSLFFKHQYMEEDFAARPEWLAAIDKAKECGMSCTGLVPPNHDHGCTSPFDPPPPPTPCANYCGSTGCAWTKQYSCPWAPSPGTRGRAGDDGSEGYDCCCVERTKESEPCGGAHAQPAAEGEGAPDARPLSHHQQPCPFARLRGEGVPCPH